jgi:hypothetical protein
VVETVRITMRAVGVGEGLAAEGEVLDQDQDQVGIATMTMILEIAVELLDGVVSRGRNTRSAPYDARTEEEDEEEGEGEDEGEVHQQREELSLFLPTMVCPFLPTLLFATNHLPDFSAFRLPSRSPPRTTYPTFSASYPYQLQTQTTRTATAIPQRSNEQSKKRAQIKVANSGNAAGVRRRTVISSHGRMGTSRQTHGRFQVPILRE